MEVEVAVVAVIEDPLAVEDTDEADLGVAVGRDAGHAALLLTDPCQEAVADLTPHPEGSDLALALIQIEEPEAPNCKIASY